LQQQQEGKAGAALGVQGLFSELLKVSPPGSFHLHDMHRKFSVCEELKPDVIVSCGTQCMPVNTVLILELKEQREGSHTDYITPANIYQASCALQCIYH
jgi:hypothetical protein